MPANVRLKIVRGTGLSLNLFAFAPLDFKPIISELLNF